ncbi:hypothetical protein [Robbsia sp. KACC 23696]|uniref:hypothetical protein n=1 Tax=Robbsia sp. KACC 23696 TaxID=3149231 RepID=UPI00325B21B5
MRFAPTSYKQLALGGLELFALFGISGLISLYFPHWVPKATVDLRQREWASVFSAGSLFTCAISLRALNMLTKAVSKESALWQEVNGPLLKWGSMIVDAAAFLWSTRACTDRDSMIVTVLMGIAYLGLPALFKRKAAAPMSPHDRRHVQPYASTVGIAALIALICLFLSSAITEI